MRLKKLPVFVFFALSFFCSALSDAFSESQMITFPILGFKTVPTEPIMLDVEWNEAWFGEKSAFEYHHGISRIACVFSEISYIEDVNTNPNNVIYRSYKALGIADENMLFHYNINYSDPLGNDQSGVTFAHKTIMSAQGERTLVFCIVRGTPRNADEWISNVNISDSTHEMQDFHEGFFIAADQIYKELLDYVDSRGIDRNEAFYLITGHSRGASVANMLGGIIANSALLDTSRVYLYTFGTPNVTTESDCNAEKYGFIWNIESVEDLCATLPPNRHGWSYKKYGHTKVLVSNWSADKDVFENDYLPRMNVYFRQMLLRDFHPFKIGPFFPVQISRLFVILNPDVNDFYKPVRGFRNKCEFMFHVVFPDKPKKRKKNKSLLGMALFSMLNWGTNGAFGYANIAVFDMHMCEGYLSWLLALSEDEVFQGTPSSQLVLSGSFDAVITDSSGETLITIKDGLSAFRAIKTPAAAMTIAGKTVIGLPGNEDFTVEIMHNSLFPTPMTVKVEHYGEDGVFEGASKRQVISPRSSQVYAFSAGKATAESFDLDLQKMKRNDASAEAKKLPSAASFLLSPSISTTAASDVDFGLDLGITACYASALISHEKAALGLGSRQNLFWRIYLDESIYAKWADDNVFPSARLSLSYKPFHTVRFFAAGDFDFALTRFGFDESNINRTFRFGIRL